MTTQINLKFQDNFYQLAKDYAEKRGYMSVQELIRDVLRERLFDEMEVKKEYIRKINGKDATTFLSKSESKKLHASLKKRAGL